MSILESDVIDIVTVDRDTDRVVLLITDHLEWDDDHHLFLLQDKINAYLRCLESGEINDSFPAAKGRNADIEVVMKYEPSSLALAFLQRAGQIGEGAGFGFRHRVSDSVGEGDAE